MKDITLNDLTEGTLNGNGIFDKLMAASKAHLDAEFKKGAIKGAEYSQVYLGQVQAVLQTSLAFLSTQQKIGLEAELLTKQIALAEAQLAEIQAQTELVKAQIDGLDADRDLKAAQAGLVRQQTLNAVQEELNLEAQECLLKSQYDNSQATVLQTKAQTILLNQKEVTERAQVSGIGVDSDSVIGKQKALYQAQTEGFTRDAEQKVAKMYCDVWNVRRTTDDATQANSTNQLDEATHGTVMAKLRAGIGL